MVPVSVVGSSLGVVACFAAVPEGSFSGKYRRIGECSDYKWKPPPVFRNDEAIFANFAARMAFSSLLSR